MQLSVFIFIAITVGLFLALDINPLQVAGEMARKRRPSFKAMQREARGQQSRSPIAAIRRQFARAKAILEITNRAAQYRLCKRLAILFAVIGAGVGIVVGNPILAVVLMLAGILGPTFVIQVMATTFQKQVNSELFTALSIVTGSYQRCENMVDAVAENIGNINPPVSDVFQEFLRRTRMVDPSVAKAISAIRPMIDSEVWRQWCDAALLCQRDPSKKFTLTSVITKSMELNRIQGELDAKLNRPLVLTMGLFLLVIGNIPIACFLYSDWITVIKSTVQGWIGIAGIAVAGLYAAYRGVRAARPLEYRKVR